MLHTKFYQIDSQVSVGHHHLLMDRLNDVPEIKHPWEIAD